MRLRIAPQFRRLTRTRLIVLSLAASAGFVTLVAGAGTWHTRTSASTKAVVRVLQGNPKKSTLEVELLTLRSDGFEPKVITRPKGQFYLAINNQSQLREELTFSLAEEKGKNLKDEKLHEGGKHRSNTLYDLNPGKYQLTVKEHPEWRCSFEITSK